MLAKARRVNANHIQPDKIEVSLLKTAQAVCGFDGVRPERPRQHDAVPQIVLFIADGFSNGVSESLNVCRCHSTFLTRLANPHRNRSLIAVNTVPMLFRHSTEGPQNKGAELIGRRLGQPSCLIHAPMLDGKVWYGKNFSDLIFYEPCESVFCDGNRYTRLVTGNPAARLTGRH